MVVKVPGEYEVSGTKVLLDEDGFLQNPENWNDGVALWMADNLLGMNGLGEEHWKLVRYLRQVPGRRTACARRSRW